MKKTAEIEFSPAEALKVLGKSNRIKSRYNVLNKETRAEYTSADMELASKTLLFQYIGKKSMAEGAIERAQLKKDIKAICHDLAGQGIYVPIDFRPYCDELYSEKIDHNIAWLQTVGIVDIISGPRYALTDSGKYEYFHPEKSIYSTKIPLELLKEIEKSLEMI